MNTPKVSVIIPVHNTENYLAQCIDSLLNQTLKDIEIVCVDDASTDSSLNILNEYAYKDNRIKVLHNEVSKSALGARKKGVAAATGEYIMFLDSDDYYTLDACEQVYNKIVEQNVDILHFSLGVINCGNVSESKIQDLLNYVKPFKGKLEGEDVFKGCFVDAKYNHTPVNKIYKAELCKKAYEQTEDVHLIFAEDLYAYFIIANNAKSYFGWDSKPFYFYCYGRGVTSGNKEFSIERFEKICRHSETIKVLRRYCQNGGSNIIEADKIISKYQYEWLNSCIGIWKSHIN
ncbi:MAG: glycosyltransferase family 2 protein, partial [Oscillospiraceae bacterium]|nr:glycosyltransferase family 2 protein [Oscillospiraceae bacterium]